MSENTELLADSFSNFVPGYDIVVYAPHEVAKMENELDDFVAGAYMLVFSGGKLASPARYYISTILASRHDWYRKNWIHRSVKRYLRHQDRRLTSQQ